MQAMQKGKVYEAKAVEYLELKGYRIIETNFRSRFGGIDIIAKDNDYVVFAEVKERRRGALVFAQEAIDNIKQSRIEKTARIYSNRAPGASYRFDVVCIEQGDAYNKYELIKNTFYMGEKR